MTVNGDDDGDVNETVTELFPQNRGCSARAYIISLLIIYIIRTSSLLNHRTAAKWDEE